MLAFDGGDGMLMEHLHEVFAKALKALGSKGWAPRAGAEKNPGDVASLHLLPQSVGGKSEPG